MAIDLEAEHLDTGLPILFTGMGKVNAAVAVAAALSAASRPREIINLGTAGALRAGLSGTHEIGTVVQHDFDEDTLFRLTGVLSSPPLTVGPDTALTLATGDSFIADDAVRARLAEHAALVDMEGYAIAAAAHAAAVPVRLIKHVSDEAGAGADRTWRESVADCSRALGAWLARQAA
ncbi:nucleosidase [Catenuloplanes indicus JCM 9534]|uniref:Adenosylhomocysteine nucleosidase n=2 Tax=Catenuloplanes indicus TaxID=137267 RepID=A0AAE3VW36_9ACTN|nr:adenosylhomocysteine nucleosidase [Catenuloplanes indicus]